MIKNNITLIGMPSSGKSTVGKVLAESLKMNFVDTDNLILKKENRDLSEIVKSEGLSVFLKIQEKVILGLDLVNSIISTGGSVVYSETSMEHLKKNSKTVYLKIELERLLERLNTNRHFAKDKGMGIKEMYNERICLYEKYADFVVDCSDKNINEIVSEIYCIRGR